MPDDQTMRERLARRVYRKLQGLEYEGSSILADLDPYACRAVGIAEAVLDEIREPTEAMLAAAVEENGSPRDPYDAWQAQIDTAKLERG